MKAYRESGGLAVFVTLALYGFAARHYQHKPSYGRNILVNADRHMTVGMVRVSAVIFLRLSRLVALVAPCS
jgi:hypothetical protein